jgi:hypothetical protein
VSEIQQQIADGARPLARVGDVIAHGETIPGNVVHVRDAEGDSRQLQSVRKHPEIVLAHEWPLTVVEVDPDPQPAEPDSYMPCGHRELLDEIAEMVGAGPHDDLAEWLRRLLPAAESGPVVLTLPQVPDGAVALRGEATGTRYELTVDGWRFGAELVVSLGELLQVEGSVTVESAPPREPRTWPKLDPVEDLPAEVDVAGEGR